MALPSSGAISFSQINVELGVSATATRSLNDSTTRTLFGVPSGQISMSQGYGKANQFSFTIASNQTNANLRTLAVAAGWNQTSKVVATINSGVFIYSTSTGTPALTINGSFPGGVQLNNNGTIQGQGGSAGNGGSASGTTANSGGNGSSGGPALSVSVPVSINNTNRIAGGGGGGGGGGAAIYDVGKNNFNRVGGGGGGGGLGGVGGSAGSGGTATDRNGSAGGAGTLTTNGGGGAGGSFVGISGGTGGSGGTYGSSGATATAATATSFRGAAGSGGGGGAAVVGNANITWIATGTRNGGIS